MNKISIIVPVYNIADYILDCIQSIVNQTYRNIEILLINDGSTDYSRQICEEFANKDDRIVVINQKNGGLSCARNKGLHIAKGEFVTFVDGDDMLLPNYIEILYNDMIENNADISICGWQDYIVGNSVQRDYKKDLESVHVWNKTQACNELFYQKIIDNSAWAKLYKSYLFNDVEFPENALYEDFGTIYKVFLKAEIFTFREYKGYVYTLRNTGIMLSEFTERKMVLIDFADEMIEYVNKNYEEILIAAKSRFIRANFHMLLQIPMKSVNKKYRDRIKSNITKYRYAVLRDRLAKRGTKISLIISFVSFDLLVLLRKAKKFAKK